MKIGYIMQEGSPDIRKEPLSGPANHVWQVFKELQNLGHSVRLLVNYDRELWVSDDLAHFQHVRVVESKRGLSRKFESLVRGIQARTKLPYFNLFDSLYFANACIQELGDCDLYYERMGWMGYGAGLAANRKAIPLVLEANNGDDLTELKLLGVDPHGMQLKISLWLMRQAVFRATHIVATGDGHRTRFINHWHVAPEKVSVVENGSELAGLLRRDQLRNFKSDSNDDPVKIVFVGAFEPWHGITILLHALARVISQGCRVHLDLIGSGTEGDKINNLIVDLNLQQNVTLTGYLKLKDLATYLVDADIGASPYCGWMEYSGLKLFDYKSAGLAVIASGRDGQPSVIRHGITGWIVPPCDEDALTDAILYLAQNRELRRKLGQTARLEAEEQHRWENTAENLVAIFNQILATGQQSQ